MQLSGSEISSKMDTSPPGSWTSEASRMFIQATSGGSRSATSSPASVVGATPFGLPDGVTTDLFGLAPARANLSPRQAKELGLMTRATSGRRSTTSSKSAALQSSLESRLRLRLNGSALCMVIWRAWATPWGPCLSKPRALARPIGVIGSGGLLPTPSGTSNHGKNHVAGRIDEWGGSGNCFRGTPDGNKHLPGFELWTMGFPDAWRQLMPPATRLSRKSRPSSLNA